MNVYIDADVFAAWEKGRIDLPAWLGEQYPEDHVSFPATVWQQLLFGRFAWDPARAQKRRRYLASIGLPVVPFARRHAERAAQVAADLKTAAIGFADCQIAALAMEENAELLTYNTEHFQRVAGLRVVSP